MMAVKERMCRHAWKMAGFIPAAYKPDNTRFMTNIYHAAFIKWLDTKSLRHVFMRAGEDIRVVGGAVRDALMGREVVDVDFCTPLLPEQTMNICRDACIRTIPTGIEHGTITALIGTRHFEITTL